MYMDNTMAAPRTDSGAGQMNNMYISCHHIPAIFGRKATKKLSYILIPGFFSAFLGEISVKLRLACFYSG